MAGVTPLVQRLGREALDDLVLDPVEPRPRKRCVDLRQHDLEVAWGYCGRLPEFIGRNVRDVRVGFRVVW